MLIVKADVAILPERVLAEPLEDLEEGIPGDARDGHVEHLGTRPRNDGINLASQF